MDLPNRIEELEATLVEEAELLHKRLDSSNQKRKKR